MVGKRRRLGTVSWLSPVWEGKNALGLSGPLQAQSEGPAIRKVIYFLLLVWLLGAIREGGF